MSMLLSLLAPIMESIRTTMPFDVGLPVSFIVVSLAIILIIAAGIIILIVFAVKYLKRLAKKNQEKNG